MDETVWYECAAMALMVMQHDYAELSFGAVAGLPAVTHLLAGLPAVVRRTQAGRVTVCQPPICEALRFLFLPAFNRN